METLPYILILIILGVNLKVNTKISNDFVFFVIFLFSALRYEVGFDYMSYSNTIINGADYEINRFEPMQKVIALVSRNTFPQLFFIVNSFISVYFTKWTIQKISKDVSLSLLTFFSLPLLFTQSLSIVRFWSALAVILYASTLLPSKKYIAATFLFMMSLTLHAGAIVALLFIPLYLTRFPVWVNIAILLFGFIGGEVVLSVILSKVLPSNLFTEELLMYAQRIGPDGMKKIPYLFLLVDILAYFKICKKETDAVLYKQFTIYNVGVSLMFLFSFQTTFSIRFASPFLCYILAIIPYLIEYKTNQKKLKGWNLLLIAYWLFCSAILIYNITIYNTTLGRSQYLPYKVFFMN